MVEVSQQQQTLDARSQSRSTAGELSTGSKYFQYSVPELRTFHKKGIYFANASQHLHAHFCWEGAFPTDQTTQGSLEPGASWLPYPHKR